MRLIKCTAYHRLPIADCRLPTNNFVPPSAIRLRLTAYRLPPSAYRLPPSANCQPPTAFRQLPTAKSNTKTQTE